MTEKKDIEGPPIKYKNTTDVLSRPVNDLMDQKDHFISI